MKKLFSDVPEAVEETVEDCPVVSSFTLANLGYEFPKYPVGSGETMISFLHRQRTDEGARLKRFRPYHDRAQRQIERELALIEKLDLAGYFLIVRDLPIEFYPRCATFWRKARGLPPAARYVIRWAHPQRGGPDARRICSFERVHCRKSAGESARLSISTLPLRRPAGDA